MARLKKDNPKRVPIGELAPVIQIIDKGKQICQNTLEQTASVVKPDLHCAHWGLTRLTEDKRNLNKL